MVRVIRRETVNGVPGVSSQARQSFLYPADIFDAEPDNAPRFWTCVRTRPRWEKKFAGWLVGRRLGHFLPVIPRATVSGRKRRVTEIPVFPGYVFVEGDHKKGDFDRTGIVAYVLKPRCLRETAQLHRELWGVWMGLVGGLYVTPIQNLATGELCRIVRGPLQGVSAKYERTGRNGRLVLQVEMMGSGLAVDVSADDIEVLGSPCHSPPRQAAGHSGEGEKTAG